jgi:hypothetical protein
MREAYLFLLLLPVVALGADRVVSDKTPGHYRPLVQEELDADLLKLHQEGVSHRSMLHSSARSHAATVIPTLSEKPPISFSASDIQRSLLEKPEDLSVTLSIQDEGFGLTPELRARMDAYLAGLPEGHLKGIDGIVLRPLKFEDTNGLIRFGQNYRVEIEGGKIVIYGDNRQPTIDTGLVEDLAYGVGKFMYANNAKISGEWGKMAIPEYYSMALNGVPLPYPEAMANAFATAYTKYTASPDPGASMLWALGDPYGQFLSFEMQVLNGDGSEIHVAEAPQPTRDVPMALYVASLFTQRDGTVSTFQNTSEGGVVQRQASVQRNADWLTMDRFSFRLQGREITGWMEGNAFEMPATLTSTRIIPFDVPINIPPAVIIKTTPRPPSPREQPFTQN